MQGLVASTEIKVFPLKFDLALAAHVQTRSVGAGMLNLRGLLSKAQLLVMGL